MAQVAAAVQPGARRPEGSGTKRSAVSSGPPDVAGGQALAADVQLADGADRQQPHRVVQHPHAVFAIGRPIGTISLVCGVSTG